MNDHSDSKEKEKNRLLGIILLALSSALSLVFFFLCLVPVIFYYQRLNADYIVTGMEDFNQNTNVVKTLGSFVQSEEKNLRNLPLPKVGVEVPKVHKPTRVTYQISQDSTDWKARQEIFCDETGFKGKLTRYEKPQPSNSRMPVMNCNPHPLGGRLNFQYLRGQFNLPEPVDTTTFKANCDFIVKKILEMYDRKGIEFSLVPGKIRSSIDEIPGYYTQRFSIRYIQDYNNSCYQVYKANLLCYYIDISYKHQKHQNMEEEKEYNVTNALIEHPLVLPENSISKDKAVHIVANFVADQLNIPLNEVLEMPVQSQLTFYVIQYVESDYYEVISFWHIKYDDKYKFTCKVDALTGKIQ